MSRQLRLVGWATLVANCTLVVTGGAVRLTDSGLGCPTWPRCTDESFTPHGAMSIHEAIEFGNRMLTFVLVGVAIVTFAVAYRAAQRHGRVDLRRIALVLALGIPAQALIGGVTVLTDLNPWVVSLHLLVSLAIIGLAVLFLWRIDHPAPLLVEQRGTSVSNAGPTLAWLTFAATWVVLYLGTVVTGSGPHAGDAKAPRNGLDPLQVSQLHADSVFLLLGLTVALVVVTRTRAVMILLGVELAQGTIGFVQYFTDLPEVLVGVHMLGAAILSATVTWVLLDIRERSHSESVSAYSPA